MRAITSISFLLLFHQLLAQVGLCDYSNKAKLGIILDSLSYENQYVKLEVFNKDKSGYEKENCIYSLASVESDRLVFNDPSSNSKKSINVDDIHFLQIDQAPAIAKNFLISDQKYKALDGKLKSIKQVTIHGFGCPECEERINVNDLTILSSLDFKLLESLIITSHYISGNEFINKCPNLEYINTLYDYFNGSSLQKDTIMYLNANNPIYYFSNNLANKIIKKNDMYSAALYEESNFPQMQFFIEHSINTVGQNPFNDIYDLKIDKKATPDASILLHGKNLGYTRYKDKDLTDSVFLSGKLENGKETGMWKFKFFPTDKFYYTLDFDAQHSKKVEFPQNGEWIYKYVSERTAIKGEFKDGKKNGVWKFYYPNGKIAAIKTFSADLPTGLWENYNAAGKLIYRQFYSNPFEYVSETFEGKKVRYQSISNFNFDSFNSDENGDLLEYRNGEIIRKIKSGTKEYNKIIAGMFQKKFTKK